MNRKKNYILKGWKKERDIEKILIKKNWRKNIFNVNKIFIKMLSFFWEGWKKAETKKNTITKYKINNSI